MESPNVKSPINARWTPASLREDTDNNFENPPHLKHSYPILQINGQRVYSPISRMGSPLKPSKGTEVFVGNLPRNLFEDELIPVFSMVGQIRTLRLMMDFSGLTRGFGFVTYFSEEEAKEAVRRFDNYQIRYQAFITVHKSVDNRRLFFGNIPKQLSRDEIYDELDAILDGVTGIILYQDSERPHLNRGFAFVEFESHAKAAIARRKMLAQMFSLWGNVLYKVFVDWAEPEPVVEPLLLAQVTKLYVKNIPVSFSCNELKTFIITILGNKGGIERIYKRNNYAFMHFANRHQAECAYHDLTREPLRIGDNTIQIEWARPATYSKRNTRGLIPNNLCTSVPPSKRKQVLEAKHHKLIGVKAKHAASTSSSSRQPSSSNSSNFTDSDSINGEADVIAHELQNLMLH